MRTKILFACLLIAGSILGADFKQGFISYTLTSSGTVSVERVDVRGVYASCDTTRFEIPETVEFNGHQLTVTAIGKDAFQSRIDTLILPKTITSVGDNAFCYAYLKSISLPDGLKTLGNECFQYCQLKEIHLPDSLNTIGEEAFAENPLTEIHFPEGLTSIKSGAFSGCKYLTEIDLPASVKALENYVFSGCENIEKVTTHGDLKYIKNTSFSYCSKLTTIVFGGTVDELGGFSNCTALESFTVPEGTRKIYATAFSGCSSLKEMVIPNSVCEIGMHAFSGCTSLTEVTLPPALKSVGSQLFMNCKSLQTLTIGENVTMIASDAFRGCTSLRHLIVRGRTPSKYSSSSYSQEILDLFNEAELSVPTGSKDTYANADFWKNFKQVTEFAPGTLYQAVQLNIKEGGRVSCCGQVIGEGASSLLVPEGEPFTLTFLPDDGYRMREVEKRYTGGINYLGKNVVDNQLTVSSAEPEDVFWVFWGVARANLDIVQNEMGRVRLSVDINKTYSCRIIEEEGWQVHSITYNGEDITDRGGKENYIQTPVVKGDAVVRVALEQCETGITKTEHDSMRVLGNVDGLVIENTKRGEQLNVYRLNGQLLKSVRAIGGSERIALPSGEIYLIKTKGKTIKIRL